MLFPGMDDVFEAIVRARRDGRPAALATVVDRKGSTPGRLAQKMLVHRDASIVGTIGGGCVEADVIRESLTVMENGRTRKMSFRLAGEEAERTGLACGGVIEIMIEPVNDPRLFVVGAGHVGQRIANLAKEVGFFVTVLDDRPDFADPEKFPEVDEVVCRDLSELDDALKVGPGAYVISVTRGHDHDFEVLEWALTTEARRIGVIGSRSKRVQFFKKLGDAGFSAEALERVSCPVGLDIGADTPAEIAIAVVGWLIADRRGRSAT